jgi:hypothetical protein
MILRQRVIQRRQKVRLADAEPAVEVQSDAGHHRPPADQPPLALTPAHGHVAEFPARAQGRCLAGLVGVTSC